MNGKNELNAGTFGTARIILAIMLWVAVIAGGATPVAAKGWSHQCYKPLPADQVDSSNLSWRVSVEGDTRFEPMEGRLGHVTFTGVVVNVDQYPLLHLDIPRVQGEWRLRLGLERGALTEVHRSTRAGKVNLDLPLLMGWSGIVTADCQIVLEDTSSDSGMAVRFDLRGAANKDVIYENQTYSAASRFGEGVAAGMCFVEDGWNDGSTTATGLPPNRVLAGSDSGLGSYRLLPYNAKNCIELDTYAVVSEVQHIIDVPNFRYAKIGMLVSSVEGDTMLSVRQNYTDGSVVTSLWWSDDWYIAGGDPMRADAIVISNMNRVVYSNGIVDGGTSFNMYEFFVDVAETNKVLDSITIGTRPYHEPSASHAFAGVFAVNGRALSTNASFIDLHELKITVRPGWAPVDEFDTHHWVGRWTNFSYGPFEPFDDHYDGARHPFESEFSTAHPVEGERALRVKMPILPAAQFNWMHFETELPEPEDWTPYEIITFDPYMEESPLGLPLMGLIVENTTGGYYRVPLILGWQLFQWENRQMTWPLQGNVAAGEKDGVQQWQIPPIPFDFLSNVVKVSCGFEYYFDPEMNGTYVHMDNMRLGATQMWDSFNGPSLAWFNEDSAVRCGIGGNRTCDASAGSLVLLWPGATNYCYARTGAQDWEYNWQGFSHIELQAWAAQTGTQLRVTINGSLTTTVAVVGRKEQWVPVTWDMPVGVTNVTEIEIGVMNAPNAGKVYLDRLRVGGFPSRVEALHAWALKEVNQLKWRLSETTGVQNLRICWQTNDVPASATGGASYEDIALGTNSVYVWNHEGALNDRVYHYALFVHYGGGTYSPVAADAVARVSRRILPVGGASDTFEAGFSKDNGALLYVHDRETGRTISHGTEGENLWRAIFVGEEAPDLHAAWFSPDTPGLHFSYSESPLVLNYRYENGDEWLGLSIAVDAWQTNKLRLCASMTNETTRAVRTVELPRKLSFAITNINRVVFPIQEGMAFRRDFFESGRYSIQPRPWLFADFIGLDSSDGFMSLYALQDSFFGSDILPRHDAEKPIFQPANVGVGASMDVPGKAFMDYEMVTYIPPGGAWNGPTMVVHVDRDSVRSSIAAYKELNGFNDTNRYPTLKMKLDRFGLFEKIAGSPFMAIECDKVVNWLKAPWGRLWEKVEMDWLDILPRDNILHFTHWQEGILEDFHPDCQPIQWEKYGDYNSFTSMLHSARSDGWTVMPFLNWTVWNKPDVVRRDSRQALLPIPEGALKVNGTPFYEYLGYMVKPWDDRVYEAHSNMMMFYHTEQPMDLCFVDMTCERTWRYTRVDGDGDGEDESVFTGYTQGTIDHNNYLKQFFPLYTEGVMDSMMGEVSGYCQTHRQKMMMNILSHVGTEFEDWVIYPIGADVAHDHVGFYQHDLNLQVFPRTKALITHYTVMGYCYIVDVATWYGEVDADGLNWMYICDDFQKAVVSKCFGRKLNKYEGAVGGDQRIILTSYGEGTNEVTVIGNFRENDSYITNGCQVVPQGFLATLPSNRLVAGIFSNMFNGASLADGEHFIAVEQISDSEIHVRHPGGADTPIEMSRPASWSGEVVAFYVLKDGAELFAPKRVSVDGDRIILNYTALTDAGSPVASYKIVDIAAHGNLPPRFVTIPACEVGGSTQVWVRFVANKPVSAVVHYGLHTPDEYAVTNVNRMLAHGVLVNLPLDGEDWWFRVTITDEQGESFSSGRIRSPINGVIEHDELTDIFLGEHGVVRADLAGVANKDIVYNADDPHNDVFGELPGDMHCFVVEGWNDGVATARGLPPSRLVPSRDEGLGTYILRPYDEPNAVELCSTGTTRHFFMPLATPGLYDRIGFIGASTPGNASFRCRLHYQGDHGGHVAEVWFGLDSWTNHTRAGEGVTLVVSNMDMAVAADGTISDVGRVNLYEYIITGLSQKEMLQGIEITEQGGGWSDAPVSWGAVLAVNLRQRGVYITNRLDLASVAEKDLVVNAGDVSNDRFGGDPAHPYCFVEDGTSDGVMMAAGLPTNRLVESTDEALGAYELLSYDDPNAVEFVSTGVTKSVYLPLSGMGYCKKIGILAAATPNAASFRLNLHYRDAFGAFTNTAYWWEADSWTNHTRIGGPRLVAGNMDWAVAADGALEDRNNVNLYEYIFTDVDERKLLTGITITEAPASWPGDEPNYAAVLGVNCLVQTNILAGWSDLNGWRGFEADPDFVCRVVSTNNKAYVTLPAMPPTSNQIYGRVLSQIYNVDLERFPILEMHISGADHQGAGYTIGIQDELYDPWPLTNVFNGTRSGTVILNLRKLTGWGGIRRFSVSFSVSQTNQYDITYVIDDLKIRADQNVAWQEDFNPPRDSWGNAVSEFADLTYLGGGTSRFSNTGGRNWGQMQSEAIALDLREYPWITADVKQVDEASNFKAGIQYQDTDPWPLETPITGGDAPWRRSAQLEHLSKLRTEVIRAAMIMEGEGKSAIVDQLVLQKRPGGESHLTWDTTDTTYSVGEGEMLWVGYTATDYDGKMVWYDSYLLPEDASYDGFLCWTTEVGDAGTRSVYVMASNETDRIQRALTITVTNEVIQLPAPLWNEPMVVSTDVMARLTGTYTEGTTNQLVQVSINGGAFVSTQMEFEDGVFTWTGAVSAATTLGVRLYDPVANVQSSTNFCNIYPGGGPAFLVPPRIERESATSVWVLVRATTQVTAQVSYGRFAANEWTANRTTLALSHGVPAVLPESSHAYWFQVLIRDATGRSAVSEPFHYPLGGAAWQDRFDDHTSMLLWETGDHVTLSVTDGCAQVHLPAADGGTKYGKISSGVLSLNVDQFPILELAISNIAPSNVGYAVSVREQSLYQETMLFGDARGGKMLLNIPEQTGWGGVTNFRVEFFVSSDDANPQTVALDHMTVRTDASVAWEDGFDSISPLWTDETGNTNFNAGIMQGPDGTAHIVQAFDGSNDWGQVQSEMLVMNLAWYPWLTMDVADIDYAANFIGAVQYQTPPYDMNVLVSGADTPYVASGEMGKGRTNFLDMGRVSLIIEGTNKAVWVNSAKIARRAARTRQPYWDTLSADALIGRGMVLTQYYAATDFQGEPVEYDVVHLPGGAAYDGVFVWDTTGVEPGSYRPTVIARSGEGVIYKPLRITVTNATVQLPAPTWSEFRVLSTTDTVCLEGTYEPWNTNIHVELSIGGGAFSTNDVVQTNANIFEWSGAITSSPMIVRARARDLVEEVYSSIEACEVYSSVQGPIHLAQPVVEFVSGTSIWVMVRAATQVHARVYYGRGAPDEAYVDSTEYYSLTHAVKLEPLLDGWAYWFQVVIEDEQGRQGVSEKLYYPIDGIRWSEDFADELFGWRDAAKNPDFLVDIKATNGVGRLTIPGTDSNIYGKALSPMMRVDVDQFPILEVAVSKADYTNAHYEIGLQEESNPWRYYPLVMDTRSGTMVLNIPDLTGWHGERIFAVSISLGSAHPEPYEYEVDYIRIRADRNLAWVEDCEPLRVSWIDESVTNVVDAYLTDLAGPAAELRVASGALWGKVMSEMLFIDLARYPWSVLQGTGVMEGATLKLGALEQKENNLLTDLEANIQDATDFSYNAAVPKLGTNDIDFFRLTMILEGEDLTAGIKRLQVCKRPLDIPHRLYWDFPAVEWTLATGDVVRLPFTATDFEGAEIIYEANGLPPGATYNGGFAWTPEYGQYDVEFIARSPYFALTNVVSIMVTGAYKVCLGYDDVAGSHSFAQAIAAQTNYTGAAALWMVGQYIHAGGFTDSQQDIYDATIHDPLHRGEITRDSAAAYLASTGGPLHTFTARTVTNLDYAVSEIMHWLDYDAGSDQRAPVCILAGNHWGYKVVRGFETDMPIFRNGGPRPTAKGFWLNDGAVRGLGHNLFVPAHGMADVFAPTEGTNKFFLVGSTPVGAVFDSAVTSLYAKTVRNELVVSNQALAARLNRYADGEPWTNDAHVLLHNGIPMPLWADKEFTYGFESATNTRPYVVNADDPTNRYYLIAGSRYGRGSTHYVLKINPGDGSMVQATWVGVPGRYPAIDAEAAEWHARLNPALESAPLLDARLVHDAEICPSPFAPAWRLEFLVGMNTNIEVVPQGIDLGGDTDGDGMSDADELFAGTDPEDKDSLLDLSGLDWSWDMYGNHLVIQWPSATNRTYGLYRGMDDPAHLTRYISGLPATPPLNTITDNPPDAVRIFYRVDVE
ncbi:MAG: hypothetical protein EOM20_07045 [Spartobacteria bacterium]|nr:hypothetical protein [Spartobacteria bacterium]